MGPAKPDGKIYMIGRYVPNLNVHFMVALVCKATRSTHTTFPLAFDNRPNDPWKSLRFLGLDQPSPNLGI